jgi:prolyl-tRNA editing enzyme YbaK/EbsC (Cys-tRNA(Pro) deacylase)
MSLASVQDHLARYGRADDIVIFETSSATVELAAQALGVENALIAKTISVYTEDGGGALLVVAAGDARLAGGPFKRRFGFKPRMLRAEDVESLTGHAVGGVCPFGNPEGVEVWLDESLRRFDTVWPAAGDTSSAVGVTLGELETYSGASGWVDVTNSWRDAESES